jgi:CBS domain containing-hemolysin-like protein
LAFPHHHRRVVTLEDVLESLIQEEIYDEYDRQERRKHDLAKWGFQRWRRFVRHQKKRRGDMTYASIASEPKMLHVVEEAVHKKEEETATEYTSLLGRLNPFA